MFTEFLSVYFCLESKELPPITIVKEENEESNSKTGKNNKKKRQPKQSAQQLNLFSDPWMYPIQTVASRDYILNNTVKNFNNADKKQKESKEIEEVQPVIRLYDMDLLRVMKD